LKHKSSNDVPNTADVDKNIEELEKDLEKANQNVKETKKIVGDAKKIIQKNNEENEIPVGDDLINKLCLSLIRINKNCMTCALSYTSVVEDYKKIGNDVMAIFNLMAGDLKTRGKLTIQEELKQLGFQI